MGSKDYCVQFARWYYTLTAQEAKKVKKPIIENCKISRAVFYNWLSSKTVIPEMCRKEIEKVAGKPIFQ